MTSLDEIKARLDNVQDDIAWLLEAVRLARFAVDYAEYLAPDCGRELRMKFYEARQAFLDHLKPRKTEAPDA